MQRVARKALTVIPAGLLLAGPPVAVGQVFGNAGQSQSITNSTDQESAQKQAAGNSGAVDVGNPLQNNDQGADTQQKIKQQQTGTFIVFGNGGPIQQASEKATTKQVNDQDLSGYTIVGDPVQDNRQRSHIGQNIDQTLDGQFVVLGHTVPLDPGIVKAVNGFDQCGICEIGLPGGGKGKVIGGDLSLSGEDEDYGTTIVFGDLTQSMTEKDAQTENNDQSLGGSGNVIVGSPKQANDQLESTDQDIHQRLTGNFIIFGFLLQTASEEASHTQINHQH